MTSPRVLFVSSEVTPFAKVGGLADVVGALPAELRAQGVDCRVIMPLYRRIRQQFGSELRFLRWSMLKMGWRSMYSGLLSLEHEGVSYYFIDNEYYFGQESIYLDYAFDIERFCFFQRAVLEAIGPAMDFQPNILHCNDWQTGLIPTLLQAHYWPAGFHRELKVVYTIHNLKYQGIHGRERIADLCDLSSQFLNDYGVLKDDVPNFMKAGIVYSNHVTTVSPSYAREILTSFYGEGLDGVLNAYSYKLSGILNGIDTEAWNPERDRLIERNYNVNNWTRGKRACRVALCEELGFPDDDERPLAVMISRLVDQKGLDLLIRVLDEILDYGIRVAVLGTGDPFYEQEMRGFEQRRPDAFRALIHFDNALAHRMYAGADMFLMPSIFEPCGLSQMISMRYGTIPIVRETGGLSDTVTAYNQYTGEGDGFSFTNINAHEFLFTTKYAADVYRRHDEAWAGLVETAMRRDFSWARSASRYLEIYQQVMGEADEES